MQNKRVLPPWATAASRQDFIVSPAQAVDVYRRREEHERVMALLVISASHIQMEAAMEDSGCLPATRSWN